MTQRNRWRVLLNGADVTHDTFYVDTRRGIVRLMKRNADGQHYVDRVKDEIAWEERRGCVQLRPVTGART